MANKYLEKIAVKFTIPFKTDLKRLMTSIAKPKAPPAPGTASAIKFEKRPEKAQTVHKEEGKLSLWDIHQRKNPEYPGGKV